MLILAGAAQAAYLINVPQELRQPNGDLLKCLASGDEFYNWLHDAAGYTIVQNPKTGWYVYAEPDPDGDLRASAHVAGRSDPRRPVWRRGCGSPRKRSANFATASFGSRPERLQPQAPRSGAFNNLAVFIRFSGENEFTDAPSVFTNMLNASGPSDNSMYGYFREASYSTLSISTSIYPTPSTTVISLSGRPTARILPTVQ